MEETNVKLINKLRQKYLNITHIGENDGKVSFIFSTEHRHFGAEHLKYSPHKRKELGFEYFEGYRGTRYLFNKSSLKKIRKQKKQYIEEIGVDDIFLEVLSLEFKSGDCPICIIEWVAKYICELKNPEYIIKFLDFYFKDYCLDILADGIIKLNSAEYIKLFIEKIKPYRHKCKESYKKLKKAYKQAVKSNKAGV